jgi:hypothetical protein
MGQRRRIFGHGFGYHVPQPAVDHLVGAGYAAGVKRALFVVAVAVVSSGEARGQVREYECTPAPLAPRLTTQVWHRSNRCLPIYIDSNSPLFAAEGRDALVADSLGVWNAPGCTDLELLLSGPVDQRPGFDFSADDNRNVISEVLNAQDRRLLPDPNALATTVTFHNAETGEIYDADIVFNTPVARFEEVESPDACLEASDPPFDIMNTLVHELGHVIGFDHNGDRTSTMFASGPACEVTKRTLNEIDIDGVCSVYPTQQASATCEPADDYGSFDQFRNQCDGSAGDGGCRASGRAAGPWVLAVAGLLGLRRRRRVSDRRTSGPLPRS